MTDRGYGDDAAKAARWWHEVTSRGSSRAALAHLRRAVTPLEAMAEPEGLRLIVQFPREKQDRAAMLAGILSHVRENATTPVAQAIGRASLDDESALMSEGRFRRLLRVDDRDLMDAMRRLVKLSRGQVHVLSLSWSVLRWDDDETRKRWLFDYYGASSTAPIAGT